LSGRAGALVTVSLLAMLARARGAQPQAAWVADLGDGTYRNPVLHADYSDPDAIRSGEDFWLTASSFGHVPGLPILHSRDLVNWTLVNHALPRLVPEDHFAAPRHGEGVWAPSLRRHAGRYWIYYPDPDFGVYVTTASDPARAWTAPVLVKAGKGLIDPCPLWDDDGRVYLVHAWARSRSGKNNILTLLELSADGTRPLDAGRVIIDGNAIPGMRTLEGPKLYKRRGWYYVFAPVGGVTHGEQAVFRAKSIQGPFEHRIVLRQGRSSVNGPHQGALVDTPSGEWWFLHFQDKGPYGRIVHLQPVVWRDDWPAIGDDADGDGAGEPVARQRMPATERRAATAAPLSSDAFDGPKPGLQWQWQANPRPEWASLTARPGFLRLAAQPIPADGSLYMAPNLLLQKFPALEFSATTSLELSSSVEGDRAGLIVFGADYAWIGVRSTAAGQRIVQAVNTDAARGGREREVASLPASASRVWLRVDVDSGARCRFAHSNDGRSFEPIGEAFAARAGRWVGAKVGVFAAASAGSARGHADFGAFEVAAPTR
jgi:beta-xylosidase